MLFMVLYPSRPVTTCSFSEQEASLCKAELKVAMYILILSISALRYNLPLPQGPL